jgi:formiminotetrahydrofolate cyclodeaminase
MAGLVERTVTGFVDEVASESPAPGGGSSAALAGSIAAGLIGMVCRLSVDKQGLAATPQELAAAMRTSDELRVRLLALVDEDTAAFDRVMDAIRLPKATDEEKTARREALAAATLFAAEVPRETLRACRRVLDVAASLAGRANPAAASDLGVAIELARAGAEGALLNVAINLASLPDDDQIDELRRVVDEEISLARGRADAASRTMRAEVGLT